MRRSRFHFLAAWLCLIWFGLSNTLLTGSMVICRDGHGGARVEWGCERNPSGECVTTCGSEASDDPGESHPCQDTPIDGDRVIKKAPARSLTKLTIPAPFMVAMFVLRLDPTPPNRLAWTISEPERPPDALTHIRTVVLLV